MNIKWKEIIRSIVGIVFHKNNKTDKLPIIEIIETPRAYVLNVLISICFEATAVPNFKHLNKV